MSVDPPKFLFTAEGGEFDGKTVELSGDDLPHFEDSENVFGGEVRETVTRYPGGNVSVQTHGYKQEPVKLVGVLEDTAERQGWAQRQRFNLERLSKNDGIVHVEYGKEEYWGTMDAKFPEEHRGKVHYELTVRPYWVDPPERFSGVTLERPPDGAAAVAEQYVQRLDTSADPPPEADDSIAKQILLAVGEINNAWSQAVGRVRDVTSWGELAGDTADLLTRPVRSALSSAESVVETASKLSASNAAGSTGIEEMVAASWAGAVARDARRLRAALADFLRELKTQTSPDSGRTHVVGRGETLRSIAENELGDWNRWTDIADLNDLATDSVDVGDELELPPA